MVKRKGPKIFYNAANKYVNDRGALIAGPQVGAIGKLPEEFWGRQYSTPNSLNANPGFNDKNYALNMVIATFNTYTTAEDRPKLKCIPYPSLPSPGPGIKDKPWWEKIPDSLYNKVIWFSDGHIEWGKAGIKKDDNNNDIFSVLASGDAQYNPDFNPADTAYPVYKYEQFVIERIDADMEPIILLPENIYLADSTINRPKINLKKGLYQFDIWFKEERSYLPLVFEEKKKNKGAD